MNHLATDTILVTIEVPADALQLAEVTYEHRDEDGWHDTEGVWSLDLRRVLSAHGPDILIDATEQPHANLFHDAEQRWLTVNEWS